MKEPCQVVWVSDLHVGSTIGLSPRQWKVDEESVHKASEVQLSLLKFWTQFWERRKKDGRHIIAVLGGDMVDGNHHGTHQIWALDELTQVEAAVDLLKPMVNLSKKAYLLRGTTSHVGQSGRYDSLVARELGIAPYYHLRLDIGGIVFDLAHHGPSVGKRIWNIGNSTRSYGRSVFMSNVLQKRKPPDVIIRGHVHRACHETIRDNGHLTEMIVAPCWQMKTEYAHRVASEDDLSDIGGVIVGISDGRVANVEIDMMQFEQSKTVVIK